MSVGEKRGNMNYEKLLERNMMVKPKQLEAYEEQHKIFKGFQQAYPLDIFPEIEDWKAVDDALKESLNDRDWQVRQIAEDLLDANRVISSVEIGPRPN